MATTNFSYQEQLHHLRQGGFTPSVKVVTLEDCFSLDSGFGFLDRLIRICCIYLYTHNMLICCNPPKSMHVDVRYVTKDLVGTRVSMHIHMPGGSVTSMHILGRATP